MKPNFKSRSALWLILVTTLSCSPIFAQSTLTLDSCFNWARANYPMIRQFDLIEQSKAYNTNTATNGKIPQITFYGNFSYQSDVTTVPIFLPNQEVPIPPKDQYRIYGELIESVNELFNNDNKTDLVEANAQVENQRVEVELYQLKEKVSQLYFGILLYDAQIEQTNLYKKDIQSGLNRIYPAISNGTDIQASATMLEAELLKADQKIIELKSGKRAYMDMLSRFIRQPILDNTILIKPKPPTLDIGNNRPELKLFEYQKGAYQLQTNIYQNDNIPQVSLFLQAGLGKPALNVLSTNVQGYYMGGLRFSWNITRNSIYRNEIGLLSIQQMTIDHQKETFLFNTSLGITQDNAEISKLQQLIVKDYDLVSMRESVANTTKIQLDNGTATANDYLDNLNAADEARQNLAIHEIQLLQSQVHYLITTGQ